MTTLPPHKRIKLSSMEAPSTTHDLDEKALNLFSRQNAALGAETTAKLIKMKVLVYGMRGVGVETAKNLALQGVGAITLIDSTPTEVKDLGVNFFFLEEDIGTPRAKVIAPKLRELNPICVVSIADSLDEETVKHHSALVITQLLPLEELIKLNEFCRLNKVSFFYSFTGGVSCDIFVDHGPRHVVNDFNGERPMQKLITDVVQLNENETMIRYETPEGQLPISLTSGYFDITEVEGIKSINNNTYPIAHGGKDPVKTVRIPYKIPFDGKYHSGGLLTEKKIPTKYPMDSLAEKLKNPGDVFGDPPSLVSTDLINFGSEVQQHVAFYATLKFASTHGKLPKVNTEEDEKRVIAIAKALLADGSIALSDFELDEDLIARFLYICRRYR